MLPEVRTRIPAGSSVMIIDDSAHSYEHSVKVLEGYADLVTVGHYFIVEDGICHHGLEVGPKPGPYEAVETFIRNHSNFTIDRNKESFGITWNPKGYLKRIV
jgi:cephalosporin hydroxylase